MVSFKDLTKEYKKDFGDNVGGEGFAFAEMPRVPCGWFALDLALGGGIPQGKITEIFGKNGSGKSNLVLKFISNYQQIYPKRKCALFDIEACVAEDTEFIDAVTGEVLTARQIYEEKRALNTLSYDEGALKVKPVTHWYDNGEQETIEISTSTQSLKLTPNHKLLVLKLGDTTPKWLRSDQIKEGMYVCRPRHQKEYVWKKEHNLSPGKAKWVGYMLGDGNFTKKGSLGFTNADPDIIKDMDSLTYKEVGAILCPLPGPKYDYRIIGHRNGDNGSKWNPSPARILVDNLGLAGKTKKDKFIPSAIMSGSKEEAAEVLSGLYLTDGTILQDRHGVSFTNASLTMLKQMRLLWSRFGIVARVSKIKRHKKHHSQLWVITITGYKNIKKVESILNLVGYKKEQLKDSASTPSLTAQSKVENYYPHYFSVSNRRKARKNKELYYNDTDVWFDKVLSTREAGKAQTYDFTVKDTHNYIANDIVSHNTFDQRWAAKLGVNVDKLYVFQPDYGEAGVDMIEGLLGSPECGLIALDSLAAMQTTRELGNSAEKRDVGGPAFLVTQLMRKVVGCLHRAQKAGYTPTFIGVNQVRANIGSYHGGLMAPGGHAKDHMCSLRLRLYGKEVKDAKYHKDLPVINDTSFNIIKKKFPIVSKAGDYQMALFPHKGLRVGECDDFNLVKNYMTEHNILTGKSGNYKLAKEHEFRTLKDLRKFLYDNPGLYRDIKSAIIEVEKSIANGENIDPETGEILSEEPVFESQEQE